MTIVELKKSFEIQKKKLNLFLFIKEGDKIMENMGGHNFISRTTKLFSIYKKMVVWGK